MFGVNRDYSDHGDEDDGSAKRLRRKLKVGDRVRWNILSDDAKRIVQTLVGEVIAVMPPNAVDANDVWVRWEGHLRPFIHKEHTTSRFDVCESGRWPDWR